jgi:HAD superfamily hydrolase (TIGR01456 family)
MTAELEKIKSNLLAPTDTRDGMGRRTSRIVPRRLSSMHANREDLYAGPTIIAPPQHLNMPSTAHATAHAMELAKHHLAEGSPDTTPGATPDESKDSTAATTPEEGYLKTTDKFAFAFDIDGVLIKGGDVIPEAIEAMKMLNGENTYNIKVYTPSPSPTNKNPPLTPPPSPYIFVTNGGGKSEEERCLQLSRQLDIEVSPGQFICGHTPMRELAQKYKTVLVVGGEGEKCRQVAEGYGFKDVITPGDIIKDNEHTTPFRKLTDAEHSASRHRNYGEVEIEAIFVFADSRDWAGDQQIILDLCMSVNGRLGTRSATFDQGPPVFFSHNDVIWATNHSFSRIGMGALRASLEAMFKAITGSELKTIAFGKPQLGTFQFATRLLRQWRMDTHGIDGPPDTVYFVGDTPESDIRGTNEFDESGKAGRASWYSILVRTGVYREGTRPAFEPKVQVGTVLDAVRHGMEMEFGKALEKVRSGEGGSVEGAIVEEEGE